MNDVEAIKELMRQAFTQAFQAQIGKLYSVYVSNAPTVEKQQAATKRGIDNAVEAYRIAISAVDSWEG